MSPDHKRTAATIFICIPINANAALDFFFPPQRPRNVAQLPSILYSMKCSTGQCYASSDFFFFIRTLYMLSERLFELVSEPSGSSRWKYQDPPLVIFHPEHHVIIFFSPGISFFGYHNSRIISLQAYDGTKSVGLQDWDIALFILHLLRC